jgi:hypothetical protein
MRKRTVVAGTAGAIGGGRALFSGLTARGIGGRCRRMGS